MWRLAQIHPTHNQLKSDESLSGHRVAGDPSCGALLFGTMLLCSAYVVSYLGSQNGIPR